MRQIGTERHCFKCRNTYPESNFEYNIEYGYYIWCRECRENGRKNCSECKERLPHYLFDRIPNSPNEHRDECRKCFLSKLNSETDEDRCCGGCHDFYPESTYKYEKGIGPHSWCEKCRQIEEVGCWACLNKKINGKLYCRHDVVKKRCRFCDFESWLKSNLYDKIKKKDELNFDDLGCSIMEMKKYIESHFKRKMNWYTYGKKWNIKFVKPINEKGISEEELKKRFHYTNIKPKLFKKYDNDYTDSDEENPIDNDLSD